MRIINLNKILCFIFGHDYIKASRTQIDSCGNKDGMKVYICSQCRKPANNKINMDNWNECIDIPGTIANNRIEKVGLDKYKNEKIEYWD